MNERDRIEYLMNLYGLTPSQFSDKTGIQRASVSHILSNRNKPSLEILLKIYHAFNGVELAWLVAGEGNPPTLNNEDIDIQDNVKEDVVKDVQQGKNMLFSFMEEGVDINSGNSVQRSGINASARNVADGGGAVSSADTVAPYGVEDECKRGVSIATDADKRIKEIKVFYNNGTYETFIPEK